MADATGGEEVYSTTHNSIACEPCRHKKRKCDRKLPRCQQCSHDPSKCYYPEQNKRGLPPGFTSKLEARLVETEAALLYVLSQSHTRGVPTDPEDVPAASVSISGGNQSKADRVKEWENLPLRSSGEIDAWFRWKTNVAGGEPPQDPTQDVLASQNPHHQGLGSGYQQEGVLISEYPLLSPGYTGPDGSAATRDAATTERRLSGRAKELWESQRNIYF